MISYPERIPDEFLSNCSMFYYRPLGAFRIISSTAFAFKLVFYRASGRHKKDPLSGENASFNAVSLPPRAILGRSKQTIQATRRYGFWARAPAIFDSVVSRIEGERVSKRTAWNYLCNRNANDGTRNQLWPGTYIYFCIVQQSDYSSPRYCYQFLSIKPL
jgi:hypothetical protein